MHQPLIDIYQERKALFEAEHEQAKSKANLIGLIRLLVFIGGAVSLYGLIKLEVSIAMIVGVSVIFIAVFLFLVGRFEDLKAKGKHIENLVKVNTQEIAALSGNYSAFKNGEEFISGGHPYSLDLDLFGEGSIFQFVDRSAAGIGYERMAFWLLEPALEKDIIEERQEAAKELSAKLDWRQHFMATGLAHEEADNDRLSIMSWLQEKASLKGKKEIKLSIIILPILTFVALVAGILDLTTYHIFGFLFLVQLSRLYQYNKVIAEQHHQVSQKVSMLKKYALLMKAIETEEFTSKRLSTIKEQLFKEGKKASEIFNGLVKVANALDRRSSPIVSFFLNGLIMYDLRQLQRLDEWKENYRDKVPDWFEVLAEWDALNSLANHDYNHPDYCYPKVTEAFFHLDAKALGHPLLATENRIDNDLAIIGSKKYRLITGANMAGKSTFLRAVGVNLVLAMAGASVCAKEFTFSPCHMSTSMRTNDSIQKHESYFYAELKRLKSIVEQVREGTPTFIMLDEMLKGTNSDDQHAGSKALIEQLIQYDGAGLIATHDLSLGVLEQEHPENIKNQCFEISIERDQLQFDYKLKDGLNQHLNASFLMRKMGITHKPQEQGTS